MFGYYTQYIIVQQQRAAAAAAAAATVFINNLLKQSQLVVFSYIDLLYIFFGGEGEISGRGGGRSLETAPISWVTFLGISPSGREGLSICLRHRATYYLYLLPTLQGDGLTHIPGRGCFDCVPPSPASLTSGIDVVISPIVGTITTQC